MDITPAMPSGRQVIEGYGDGGFRVSGQVHRGSLLVFPDMTVAWPVSSMAGVTLDSLAPVRARAGGIEILLLGCGPRLARVAPALRAALRDLGIVVEPMDSGAACRTYNVLLSEERRVAAALIAVG